MPVNWNADAVVHEIATAAMRGVVQGTEEVRNEAVSLILDTAKSGRVYRRRGVEHQASAAGEPPASDTGRLVNSITTSYDKSKLLGRVTARAAYAAALEYGTVKMAPRPYMRPALANKRDFIERAIGDQVRAVLARRGVS